MTVYTVHEPPPRKNEDAAEPERFLFVRDGFYFWAFLLGPLWMLWHRLWLVLVLFVVAVTGIHVGLWALDMSDGVKSLVGTLIALLIGLEAASLRRWTLARRRWNNVGLVVGPDRDTAERRFYDAWSADSRSIDKPPPAVPAPPPSSMRTLSAPDVIGLFPEPEPRR